MGMVSVDLDGDGLNELVYGCATGVLLLSMRDGVIYTRSQFNFSPGVRRVPGPRSIWARRPTSTATGGRRSSPRPGMRRARPTGSGCWTWWPSRYVLDLALPMGEDRRPDGMWDGGITWPACCPDRTARCCWWR